MTAHRHRTKACARVTRCVAAAALLAGSAAAQVPGTAAERLQVAPAAAITVTAKAAEGGAISPAGTISVRQGATQQFGLVANTGWAVANVTGCEGTGIKIAGEQITYTTGRITASCNVLASFVRLAPRLTSFQINNGAAETPTPSVTLAYTAASGPTYPAPTHYRVSMRVDFLGAEWKPVSATTAIPHQLEPGAGTKTLYFQLRSARGTSEVLSDSIELAQRQRYTVAARAFHDSALQAGFNIRVTDHGVGCSCLLIPGPADGVAADHVVARASGPAPCGGEPLLCRFDFFAAGVLRNGFVLRAVGDNAGAVPGCDIFRSGGPTPGGTSINFRIQLENRPTTECQYRLLAVELEGPPNRSWREAFGLKP
ncbi:MAG: hypothetical protein U1F25_12030 [Rubrivivax sp.]